MKCGKETMLLYAITDRAWVGRQSLYEQVESALKGGITCLQLREKNMNEGDFLQEAKEICRLCKKYGVPFIINDNVEIAIKCQADGVHVGPKDMAVNEVRQKIGNSMILGATARSVEQAVAAWQNGADYLGVGAVFGTMTKKDATKMSREVLEEICKTVDIPVVAIGGINKENILQLSGSGVDGAAIVSGIFAAEDIEKECRELLALSRKIARQ